MQFGPVEILGGLNDFEMHFVSVNSGVIKSRQGTEIVTQSVNEMNTEGILVIPRGQGTRVLVNDNSYMEILYKMASSAKYRLAIFTGSALLARTGLLDGCKATSNKGAFNWVKSVNTKVDWIQKARWFVDG